MIPRSWRSTAPWARNYLPERVAAVMTVLYLIFNEGYAAAQGEALVRHELCAEAIRLTRLLVALLVSTDPDSAGDVEALLALMLFNDARREARVDARGDLVLLADQDRARWDQAKIDEGSRLLEHALRWRVAGPFALEAAIAAVHAEAKRAEDTDWRQIVALYDRLLSLHPSPVVALNRAVAVAMADGPDAALPVVEGLAEALADYPLWHATRADLLRRLGRTREALLSYERALTLTENEPERRFLARRLAELQQE
jgi:RNA polymerase sigma-70 factor (ECF subfamily)